MTGANRKSGSLQRSAALDTPLTFVSRTVMARLRKYKPAGP